MILFKFNNNRLEEIEKEEFSLEKDIQNLVENNLVDIFNLKFISTEFSISNFRLDTLAFNEENNSFVIIEYKKGDSYSVIDQGYSYLSIMLNNKAEFILELNEKTNLNIKREMIDWSQSKVIFISPSFNTYQKNSVNFKGLPFELWEIKKYKNGILALDHHKSTSTENIKNFEKTNIKISEVSSEIQILDESHHTKKCPPEILGLWNKIKETLSNIDNYEFDVQNKYISIKKEKVIGYAHFKKNMLEFHFTRGNIYKDGSKSKGYFTLDDPKNIADEGVVNWSSGDKRYYYIVKISSENDLEYLIWLFKQKAKSIN